MSGRYPGLGCRVLVLISFMKYFGEVGVIDTIRAMWHYLWGGIDEVKRDL